MKPFYQYSLNAILLVLVATSSVSSTAQTNYYRWLDKQGKPIISDRPPPAGVDYKVVRTESTLKQPSAANEGAAPLEVEPTTDDESAQPDSTKAVPYKKNPEICQRAKTNLATLSNSAKVKVLNKQGEERFMSPEEMELERQSARAQINVYCE